MLAIRPEDDWLELVQLESVTSIWLTWPFSCQVLDLHARIDDRARLEAFTLAANPPLNSL